MRRRRQLNPRQRQGLLLVIISAAGLLGVFLLVANYVSSISKQVGPKSEVLALTTSLNPYQPVTAGDLKEVSLPQKWAPPNAITDPSSALGLISKVTLPSGTYLEQGMLSAPPTLAAGDREVALLVDEQDGVAGQVQPGDTVDIIASYQATVPTGSGNAGAGQESWVQVVVPDAKVLAVGQPAGSSGVDSAISGSTASQPITFSLTPSQVNKLYYAESFAKDVRVAIVSPSSPGPPTSTRPFALHAP